MIASWWAELSLVMKILWSVTLAASLIFIIQSILTFVGADVDSDFDVDVDTSVDGSDLSNIDGGSNLYTLRNFVNFIQDLAGAPSSCRKALLPWPSWSSCRSSSAWHW